MTQTSLSQIHQTIKSADTIVLLPHIKPDGDTLGSSIALCRYLRYLGKSASIYSLEAIPDNLPFLDTSCLVNQAPSGVDLAIAIDCSDKERLSDRISQFDAPLINIDHHQSNTFFGDYNYVRPLASTGEIIYAILSEWQAPLDQAMREALYAAIATDTNRFYYRSTSSQTLRAVAELMDQGLDITRLNNLIYGQVPLAKKKLQAHALQTARLLSGGRLITSQVPRATQLEFGTTDTDDIVENLRDIAGVVVAVLSYQYGDEWRLSLRSKDSVNVGQLAQQYGGGGHFGAAGISLATEDYPAVYHRVLSDIEAQLAGR